jgi:N6-L-threonylcarbamoyladenine synthase
MNSLKILSIETSCDETSLSLVQVENTPTGAVFSVLGDITHSQIDIMREFGGVFPAVAKREHQLALVPILLKLLRYTEDQGRIVIDDEKLEKITVILEREKPLQELFLQHVVGIANPGITHICVTGGPGLEPALWVGINFAQALGILWEIPVIPVNHMEGHVLSVLAPELATDNTFTYDRTTLVFPALALLVSGGHTEIVLVHGIGQYEIIGRTRDDAVGEAFDKVARILSLPYPGGPEISKLAQTYREKNIENSGQLFPRPMMHSMDYDFSFSGLKTATLYHVRDLRGDDTARDLTDAEKMHIAYEFETAAVEVLIHKTLKAIKQYTVQTLVIGGGVAANNHLRAQIMDKIGSVIGTDHIHLPTRKLSTDNSLMIALAGYFKILRNPDTVYENIVADGNWEL